MATSIETTTTPGALLDDLFVEARDAYERETRAEMRYALVRPISIEAGDQSQIGFIREITRSSIGLLHSQELPRGEVVISIPTERGAEVRTRVQICWCKPAGHGWFLSGGEFVELRDPGD